MLEHPFSFARERGVVWVCDIEGSSQFLNDEDLVDAIEDFLPRFHWLGRVAVDAAGGRFIKWTGDGFLAWFPFELHRQLGEPSLAVLHAAWHLTVLANVTQLDVDMTRNAKLRHGIAYEKDALVTIISGVGDQSVDLIGRDVVLAFRMSGISAPFPGVVTQKEIVEAAKEVGKMPGHFRKLTIDADQRRLYFKGERLGTTNLVASHIPTPRRLKTKTVLRHARAAVAKAEGQGDDGTIQLKFANRLLDHMQRGPVWAQRTVQSYLKFLREEMLASSKKMIQLLEQQQPD